jgi:16S rRNA (cytosine1402-N4)-methyltransferase
MNAPHVPVLLDEVLDALLPDQQEVERVIDGTLGTGGHTLALLTHGASQVLGMDVDASAIEIARARLADFADRVQIVQRSYVDMEKAAQEIGWTQVDAILLDLGASSIQFDQPHRGFAFMQDGPLDMRFNPDSAGQTAADLVNYADVDELEDLFFKYGEERHSRRIARTILKERPIETTGQLAEVVRSAIPAASKGKRFHSPSIHPATRVFQALRIAVNDELNAVKTVLPIAINLLRPGGRLAVISFHSLEDRIVKHAFKDASTEIISPPGMMLEEKSAEIRLVNKKPITATEEEVQRNPRSRSAKLRVIEKL